MQMLLPMMYEWSLVSVDRIRKACDSWRRRTWRQFSCNAASRRWSCCIEHSPPRMDHMQTREKSTTTTSCRRQSTVRWTATRGRILRKSTVETRRDHYSSTTTRRHCCWQRNHAFRRAFESIRRVARTLWRQTESRRPYDRSFANRKTRWRRGSCCSHKAHAKIQPIFGFKITRIYDIHFSVVKRKEAATNLTSCKQMTEEWRNSSSSCAEIRDQRLLVLNASFEHDVNQSTRWLLRILYELIRIEVAWSDIFKWIWFGGWAILVSQP